MSFVKDLLFGGAEKDAAAAREKGLNDATAESRRQFDQTREDFAPGIERGNAAGEREAEFLGLRGAEAEQRALDSFTESPGQAFLRKRSERSLLRNEAAIGGLGGGNVRTALQEQAVGIAGTQLSERKDRLGAVARGGQNQVTNQASIGSNLSSRISDLLADTGEARGQGIDNVANARRSGLARVAGAFI